jgi:hypothetical protein
MWKKFVFGLLAVLILASPLAVSAFNVDWDDDFEASPADSDLALEGAERFRELKEAIRERLAEEHNYSEVGAGTDDGTHKEGSARIWVQDDEPEETPGGQSIDDGSIWLETDENILWIYDADDEEAWVKIIQYDDNVDLTSEQTISGTKTFDLAVFKRLMLKQIAVTAETYTAGADYNFYICDTTSNDITLTLPDGTSSDGSELYAFKLIDATNALYVTAGAGETIEGAADFEVNVVNDFLIIASDGEDSADWHILATGSPISNTVGADELKENIEDILEEVTIFAAFGGVGTNDITSSGVTTWLDGSADDDDGTANGVLVKQLRNLTIADGHSFTTDAASMILGIRGTLTMNGTGALIMDGKGAAGGTNSGAGAQGGEWHNYALYTYPTTSIGAGGGAGGGAKEGTGGGAGGHTGVLGVASASGNGGNGGTVPAVFKTYPLSLRSKGDWVRSVLFSTGAGGGAGANATSCTPGNGGAGGGFIYIEANSTIFAGTPSISADGTNGVNANPAAGDDCGAGAGGGGGCIIILYKNITDGVNLTTSVAGGSGGNGAAEGFDGGDGGTGSVITQDVDS